MGKITRDVGIKKSYQNDLMIFFNNLRWHGSDILSVGVVKEILECDIHSGELGLLFRFAPLEMKELIINRYCPDELTLIIFGASCPSAVKTGKRVLIEEEGKPDWSRDSLKFKSIIEYIPILSVKAAELLIDPEALSVLKKALKTQTK